MLSPALLMSTVKKPFTTASKFLKARRKSSVLGRACLVTILATAPLSKLKKLRHDVPIPYPSIARCGQPGCPSFRIQLWTVLGGRSSGGGRRIATCFNEDVYHSCPAGRAPPSSASQEASSSRWKEAMNSVWGFLPSFDFFAHPLLPRRRQDLKAVPSANMLEAELIPTVKKMRAAQTTSRTCPATSSY